METHEIYTDFDPQFRVFSKYHVWMLQIMSDMQTRERERERERERKRERERGMQICACTRNLATFPSGFDHCWRSA
ncbi:hypothetical protein PUN28_000663 [Cardiocondyla obscurior]|uniref:Uncharacterized protein n=1 Tax=Cardiocondyla obscurior TaxID=286306 RepID=A0AAW2H0J0_9HYME